MKRTFTSVSDVLHSAWAKAGALVKKPDNRTDRVLRSTRLEDEIYKELRTDDAAMDEIEQQAAGKLKTFPALSRDVFQSFYSLSPRRNDEEQLSTMARKFNTHILSHVTGQDDYPTLKAICEGRDMLAYDAATEFTQRTAAELDDLMNGLGMDNMETLEKLEASAQQWADELAGLLQENTQASHPDEKRDKALIGAANQLESKRKQMEAVTQIIDNALIRHEDATNSIIGAAVSAAKQHAEETRDILAAWSDEPGNLTRCPMNTELLRRVRQSQELVNISRYLGRFREIFAQGKKNGYAYGRGEKYSLELGNDLSKALYETPLRQALALMKNDGFENADVVFLTDGECALSEQFLTELHTEQAARRFTVTGILMDKGKDCFDFSLQPFCQKIYRTSELTGDDVVRAVVSERV